MKVLVGVVAYGNSKDYVLQKFLEMKAACIDTADAEIVFVWGSEREPAEQEKVFGDAEGYVQMPPGLTYAEDMLMGGREVFRRLALNMGVDKVCYQGLDCLWQSREDFERVMNHDVPVVSALTSARNDANVAVARRFDENPDGGLLETQHDIPDSELQAGGLVPSGFPGADAIFFRKDTLGTSWVGNHTPWYERVAAGDVNIECMEWTCLALLRRGLQCYVDASAKVYHVHESGEANMWKGITEPLAGLSW